MKINKVICDKCKKELASFEEIRLDVMKKEKGRNGYSLGFQKKKTHDLCEDCYNKLFEE